MALRPFVPFLLTICFSCWQCLAVADEFVGCLYESSLCSPVEVCIDDGLFGRCQQEPFDLYQYSLSDEQALLFSGELEKLVQNGADWDSPATQCSLLYVMMVQRFGWNYHPEFCAVGEDTEKVWRALKAIELRLLFPNIDEDTLRNELPNRMVVSEKRRLPAIGEEDYPSLDVDIPEDDAGYDLLPRASEPLTADTYGITDEEEELLSRMIAEVMQGKTPPELNELSDDQLSRFYRYLDDVLRTVNKYKPPKDVDDYYQADYSGWTKGEILPEGGEEPIGLQLERPPLESDLYKKDAETLGILNQGTGDKAHRIGTRKPVLGLPFQATEAPPLARDEENKHKLIVVDGNRIYIRLNKDMSADPVDAFALVKFFEHKLGFPAETFVDIDVQGDEVSFTVDQSKGPFSVESIQQKLHDARMVAKKYANEIASNYKADVLELGQGSGDAKISTNDSDDDDGFFVPVAIICGSVLAVLVVVVGAYLIRTRAVTRSKLNKLQDFESQPSKAYEELCRQRMSTGKNGQGEHFSNWLGSLAAKIQGSGGGGGAPTTEERVQPAPNGGSKTSSTSSWSEEPAQNCMDISTGHMILNYMEEHLNGEKLAAEWRKLQNYVADPNDCFDSMQPENVGRNRHTHYVPYDHNRVRLSGVDYDYINASPVVDVDPRCAVYLATQGPLPDTTGDFWQMVWEQGSVVIVNLTKLTENGDVKCCRYWPENGSEVYSHFEVHLVSEHIWCEDYLVRSFYLKNLRTNETRTVTQFHFLTWPDHGVPPAAKPLLEFRRKVNKSYRGRQCPIVVHCSDGCGRTGTYILLDLVLNRVCKGAKEMDIAAALEHLRDQRWGMVETRDQFEFVLGAIAEEVHAMLKALSNN